MDIGMQMIHFKKLSVPMSTGTSKLDKLPKMPSDSISESVIFQKFPGGMPPDPLVLAYFACLCAAHAYYECKYANYPYINIDDRSGCASLFKSLDPPLGLTVNFVCYMDMEL